jgi:hypothetical protein
MSFFNEVAAFNLFYKMDLIDLMSDHYEDEQKILSDTNNDQQSQPEKTHD